ncbi:MaoC/PaaZ C-terminal domain-containing protein [Natrarchaeobius chitinivorans]|uniref:Acyl dehydratase n=1 Tax=Natrarchaeobius chitinivorans TaxID=1679083 RepID=A0A3N6M8V5_NATCH|nr:MaoC/PaaZ C-terminal domain-containing protein [Natrarchaeobius chitinivorans]RQG91821.1 acyl dehydratase [Natrarchaeobius chitinivorans]
MTALNYDDLRAGENRTVGSFSLTETEIQSFARQYDPQPFHTDPSAAESTLFGGLVASGWQTACRCMDLLVRNFFDDLGGAVGLHMTDLQWPTPVRPGDTITVTFEILEKEPIPDRAGSGYLDVRITGTNQDDEDVIRWTVRSLVPE